MALNKMLVFVIAFASWAALGFTRGPTFPIGDGALSIAHGALVARDLATVSYLWRESVPQNVVWIASPALSTVSSVSATVKGKAPDFNLGARDNLTVIQTTITTTVITTTSDSTGAQLTDLASTSPSILAAATALPLSESQPVKVNAADQTIDMATVIQFTPPPRPTLNPADVLTLTGIETLQTFVLIPNSGVSFSATIRPYTKYWNPVASGFVTYDPVPTPPLPTTTTVSGTLVIGPDGSPTPVSNAAVGDRHKAQLAGALVLQLAAGVMLGM